jgi:hypothetical protein
MDAIDFPTAYSVFSSRLSTVQRLQEKVNGDEKLPEDERDLLFESMFMSTFRALENLIEHCFVYSMQGMTNIGGKVIPRFAEPSSRSHARDMLLGTQTVLDWTSSTTILRRYETFLKDKDSGLYLGVSGVAGTLSTAKELRNHIAHNSDESAAKYGNVVTTFFPTPPLEVPTPGVLVN